MVRPGEKISKIQKLFVNAFSNLKKIQFRYVVNLLHKTSIDKGGGGSKGIQIQTFLFCHVQLDHSHHSRGWKIRISKKCVFLNHPKEQLEGKCGSVFWVGAGLGGYSPGLSPRGTPEAGPQP